MASKRKVVFANGEIYHVLNRGVEKRPTFTDKWELQRAVNALQYYRFTKLPLRFSHFNRIKHEERKKILENLRDTPSHVEILCYCFMPNHFHFLLKQMEEGGISKFIANFSNSYTKYFNTKHERIGALFQGVFKAVHIDTDEQLLHVSRYIHLNPVSSFIVKPEELDTYPWSSYGVYSNEKSSEFIETQIILSFFTKPKNYKKFVLDQADYARTLESIKHVTLEE